MPTKRDRLPPLMRAFGLLEHIVRSEGPVALQSLTLEAGLPKPTVYRMLAMLEESGLVSREPDGRRVTVGPRLLRFALDTQLTASVRAPRHAILKRLADELGETVNLTMLDGSEVVYLDRVETAWPLRMTLQPGSHVPLHCTASGKLLLAQLPAARRRRIVADLPLVRYTENTITDPQALERELARIRREGLSTDNEEYLQGLVCVAVPVNARDGRTVACVAVHAPVARMPLERALVHLPALVRAAESLARTFGADASARSSTSARAGA